MYAAWHHETPVAVKRTRRWVEVCNQEGGAGWTCVWTQLAPCNGMRSEQALRGCSVSTLLSLSCPACASAPLQPDGD